MVESLLWQLEFGNPPPPPSILVHLDVTLYAIDSAIPAGQRLVA
jgi:hypothetical protein